MKFLSKNNFFYLEKLKKTNEILFLQVSYLKVGFRKYYLIYLLASEIRL